MEPVGPDSTEPAATARGWLNRTVVGAGITSALGDFCYETTTVILPGFLAVLGLPPAVLGTIEGIADAVVSFTKMISGYIADSQSRFIRQVPSKPTFSGLNQF